MGVCYIVGAGDFSCRFTPTADDLVIAADGGYDNLTSIGITPDLLIGDLDSIRETPNGIETLRHPIKKDETDMLLSYIEGARRGYTEFLIYGGTGGREDHTFANYSLLLYITERGHKATLFSDTGEVYMIKNSDITLSGESEKHLSIFPFGCVAHGVSIKGAEYECESITLTPEFPLAVSNRFVGRQVSISVTDGALIIMKEL